MQKHQLRHDSMAHIIMGLKNLMLQKFLFPPNILLIITRLLKASLPLYRPIHRLDIVAVKSCKFRKCSSFKMGVYLGTSKCLLFGVNLDDFVTVYMMHTPAIILFLKKKKDVTTRST